jgi:nucleolar MIF4G domain-containing protein 1
MAVSITQVSQMYAFQVVGHDLMFDILDVLSASFRPKDVELILLVLRSVGFLLRKDDPARLKAFILQVPILQISVSSEFFH